MQFFGYYLQSRVVARRLHFRPLKKSLSGCKSLTHTFISTIPIDLRELIGLRSRIRSLYRPVLTEHFDKVADREGIASTVIVEASSRPEDNQWMLDLVKHNPDRYLALVGSLPIGNDEFSSLLERFSKDSRFVGIRMRDRPGGDDFFNDAVWRDLGLLAEKGLTLDVLINNFTIDEVAEVAKRLPDLKIMINHLGGLSITNDPLDINWKESLENASQFENVYCKVSGIFQRAGVKPTPKERSFYSPVFKIVFDAFGEDRICVWEQLAGY